MRSIMEDSCCFNAEAGCNWTGGCSDVVDHLQECDCFVCQFGCGFCGTNEELQVHLTVCSRGSATTSPKDGVSTVDRRDKSDLRRVNESCKCPIELSHLSTAPFWKCSGNRFADRTHPCVRMLRDRLSRIFERSLCVLRSRDGLLALFVVILFCLFFFISLYVRVNSRVDHLAFELAKLQHVEMKTPHSISIGRGLWSSIWP